MNKVAVFGKPGSGKSTLSKALSSATGIPLHQLDSIVYQKNGALVDRPTFDAAHENILASERWVIDGFGPIGAFNQRLEAADTLIYVDLPYTTSYWFVTKRLLKGLFIKPEGWPDGSSVLKGTLASYKVLRLCPKFWNDDFSRRLHSYSAHKSVFIVRSVSELDGFVDQHCKPMR
ncbi:adenylate kinase [Salinispirillum marinum]|uniref:Adenylate kinase n=2 Tax=Saccharospirillaceae TaxID=255527 RepID=A0ABV8BGD0_9GAMM